MHFACVCVCVNCVKARESAQISFQYRFYRISVCRRCGVSWWWWQLTSHHITKVTRRIYVQKGAKQCKIADNSRWRWRDKKGKKDSGKGGGSRCDSELYFRGLSEKNRRVPIIDVSCVVAGVAKVAGKVNKQKNLNKSLPRL